MNDPLAFLTSIGLTETEASIYLGILGTDDANVQGISQKTGIKRPTVYHALDTLMEKGLVAERKIGNRVTFTACPPKADQGLSRATAGKNRETGARACLDRSGA